jgi:hypothetical protein
MVAATWTLACLLLVANDDAVQQTFYINQRHFSIPVGIKAAQRPFIKEILLYQAEPDGIHWRVCGRNPPEKQDFEFHAPDDGVYYFKVNPVDKSTEKEQQGPPQCIIVDTVKPQLHLLSAERQGDAVQVRWELVEKYPDWNSFQLEYRAADAPGASWARVPVLAPESGQASVHIEGPAVAVRLSVRDLAKNESGWQELPIKNGGDGPGLAAAGGTGTTTLPPLSGGAAPPPPLPGPVADRGWSPTPPGGTPPIVLTKQAVPTGAESVETAGAATSVRPGVVASVGGEPPAPAPAMGPPPARPVHGPLPPVQMIRKRQLTIDYEVTKFGASGIKSVELYVTRDDGRNWKLAAAEDNINVPLPPDWRGVPPALKRSLIVELQADGLYGFYLVVRSGAGLGKPPPQNGIDPPQLRVEVDTTAPKADLFEPRPHPTRRDCLILNWTATDNKLGPTPITLQWAERPDGEWQSIGSGELPNTGEYVWQVPPNIPPHVFLRLLVRDLAGNESVAQTGQPVLVDLSEPEVKPLQISAGARQ